MAKVKNHRTDKWAVAYEKDGQEHWLQTEGNQGAAIRARDIVNGHEEDNDRPAKFYVIEIGV